jgi:hypothetical protein
MLFQLIELSSSGVWMKIIQKTYSRRSQMNNSKIVIGGILVALAFLSANLIANPVSAQLFGQ